MSDNARRGCHSHNRTGGSTPPLWELGTGTHGEPGLINYSDAISNSSSAREEEEEMEKRTHGRTG